MAVKKAGHVWGEKKKRIKKKKERKTEDIEFIFFLIEVIV